MEAGSNASLHEAFELILYVPRADSRSLRAEQNLRQILDQHLQEGYTLRVVYLFEQPELLETDQILAVPTLLRRDQGREYRVVGDFTDGKALLTGIGLTTAWAGSGFPE